MSDFREPNTIAGAIPGQRLTLLDCELGSHSGHFSIYRDPATGNRWGCASCIRKLPGSAPKWLDGRSA